MRDNALVRISKTRPMELSVILTVLEYVVFKQFFALYTVISK